jgi:hypothetical protein
MKGRAQRVASLGKGARLRPDCRRAHLEEPERSLTRVLVELERGRQAQRAS